MDTKDQSSNFTSPEMLTPDTGTIMPPLDLLEQPIGGHIIGRPPDDKVIKSKKPSSPTKDSLKRLSRDKRAMVSLGILIALIVIALIGPFIYTLNGGTYNSDLSGPIGPAQYHAFDHQELSKSDQGPSAQYWLGTDNLGRDLLARGMRGVLISVIVAVAVEIVDIVLGVGIGVLAGFYGGLIDQFLARFTDLMFAFPSLLFIILLTGIFGPAADATFNKIPFIGGSGNARLILLIIALSITVWPLMARFVRGQTLQLKEQQFIEAARTSGTSNTSIILHHIVPNVFSLVFIASTLNISNTVIGEAGISLLGLGVQAPSSSLGLMISDGLDVLTTDAWEVLFPTIILTIIVLCISFLGDGLRDAFDPRSKD